MVDTPFLIILLLSDEKCAPAAIIYVLRMLLFGHALLDG